MESIHIAIYMKLHMLGNTQNMMLCFLNTKPANIGGKSEHLPA